MAIKFTGKATNYMKYTAKILMLTFLSFPLQAKSVDFGYLYIFKVNVPLKRPYYINPSSEGGIRFNSVNYVNFLGFLMFKAESVANDSLCPKTGVEIAPGVIMDNKIDKQSAISIAYICDKSDGIIISNEEPFLQELLDALKNGRAQ